MTKALPSSEYPVGSSVAFRNCYGLDRREAKVLEHVGPWSIATDTGFIVPTCLIEQHTSFDFDDLLDLEPAKNETMFDDLLG